MEISQYFIGQVEDLEKVSPEFKPDIFFLFVSPQFVGIKTVIANLRSAYPDSLLFGCSTAGEILGNQVHDDSVVITALRFQSTTARLIQVDMTDKDSYMAGVHISSTLVDKDLRHILVLSDGLNVNGAELVNGLHSYVDNNVSITGGLAGDGSDFKDTFVIYNEEIGSNRIAALGLYGEDLKIGFGSKGGWDSFGIERLVTKSDQNVLFELDGQPALELYKSFLGDKAKELPSSGLLFPLSMRDESNRRPVVRTILGVDEESQSLRFAGNIPEGSYVRLMKANVDRIINGAEQSALISSEGLNDQAQLALLISCVGRRLVMKQLVEEEVEAVNDVLGPKVYSTGFYSYGEIAPFNKFTPCELHNQTMTITLFSE